ncbi:MAG: hypothetical protein JW774_05740 [Candidatus Aureabacteria bacterium]|nr:hypothetical protein [Candidatus Auribacterota bacterium]
MPISTGEATMDISGISSNSIIDVYAQAVRVQTEQLEKLAKINMEQEMEAEKMATAVKALLDIMA